jgi:hypothetical protein
MGHGGKRRGAGRPPKNVALAQSRLDAATDGSRTAAEYLTLVLNGPNSSRSQRLRAAELLLKRPTEAPSAAEPLPIVILSVPRGTCVDLKTGIATTPDGAVAEMEPFEPFTPTPPLPLQRDERVALEPLPVTETEIPENVMRLDAYLRRREGDDEPGPGAA